jgi:hypothetical protein
MTELRTTRDVVQALGGPRKLAELLGEDFSRKRVWHWQTTTFPASTYVALQRALKARGLTAPASLWGMKQPRPATAQGAAA